MFSLIITDVREHQERQFEKYYINVLPLKEQTKDKNFYNYIKEVAFNLEEKRLQVESINEKGKKLLQ